MKEAGKFSFLAAGIIFLACVLCPGEVCADVAVKIVIANPSEEETQTVPVHYELPPGLERRDILDPAGLNVEYDMEKSMYYVYGSLELEPKEVRTLKIIIRDVWTIPQEKIRDLYGILDNKINSLKGTVDEKTLKLIEEGLRGRLGAIERYQEDAADDIEKRMRMYSSNAERLQRIRKEIFLLDKVKEIQTGQTEPEDTLVLIIEGENILDEKVDVPLKYYLPREIIPQYIEDAGGFEVRHDPGRDRFYLFREEAFDPHETKRFHVKIKNVWIIPEDRINAYVEEASALNERFADTAVAEVAEILFNTIKETADLIIESQQKAESVKGYISAFRINKIRLQAIEDDLEKLRNLEKDIKLEEEKAKEAKRSLVDVLQEMDVLSKIKELSDRLFKEKLTAGIIWKIILIIVAFVIILSSVFYVIWITIVKKEEKRDMKKVESGSGGT